MKKVSAVIISIIMLFNLSAFAVSEDFSEPWVWSANEVSWYIEIPESEEHNEDKFSLFSEEDMSWYDPEESSYTIANEEQFRGFVVLTNEGITFDDKTITLLADINFTSAVEPINTFNGEFNGNGKNLSGIYIAVSGDENTGLFKALGINAYAHDFTVSGRIAGKRCAAVVGTNDGKIERVASLMAVQGDELAGGICVTNNGAITNSSANASVSISSDGITMGGICAENTNIIGFCENKAEINTDAHATGSPAANVGGIAGANSGVIKNSYNYSDILGKEYIGGITGKNTGTIENCINAAEITAMNSYAGGITGSNTSTIQSCINSGAVNGGAGATAELSFYTGGIAGTSNGEIKECENSGGIISNGNGAGGIVGVLDGTTQYCTNYGTVTATASMAGGISGDTSESASVLIENSTNYGIVTAVSGAYSGGIAGRCSNGKISLSENNGTVTAKTQYAGGIAGGTKNTTIIERCGNIGTVKADNNFTGGIVGMLNGTVENCYNVSENISSGWNCGALAGIASENSVRNSYSIGTLKLIGSNSATENSYLVAKDDESLTDGTLLAKLNVEETIWYCLDENYPVPNSYIFDLLGNTAYASTYEELTELLENEVVEVIILANNIDGDITIDRSIEINGQYNSIGKITQNTPAVLKNLYINGGIESTAELTLQGMISIDNAEKQGIKADDILKVQGCLDFGNNAIPMVKGTAAEGLDAVYYDEAEGAYYFNYPVEETANTTIAVKASNNSGIVYDIYPHISGSSCYFFMPYSADLSNITYTKISSDGTEENITVDLSDGKTETINIMGLDFTASAMQSELPALYLDIDETYGSIYTMNNSPEHDDKCYGDMRLEIPEELAELNGWDSVYESVENDEEKPCTVEIKGRGNSSWSQAIRDNGPRPYQIKLEKKANIMGMGKAKTYTLLKADQTHTNNKTFLDMAIDMGLKFTPQAEFVELFMNGDYLGLYTLAEKVQINSERVDITDLEDEVDNAVDETAIDALDLTGGYLLEIDNTYDELQFTTQGNRISIKGPENLDSFVGEGSRYTYIEKLMTDLMDAVYGDGYLSDGRHFSELLDMDSTVRYYLHQELSSNMDAGLGSTYFYKDRDSIDPKIYMGVVWDNDRCGGGSASGGWQVAEINTYGADGTQETGGDSFFKALCKHKEFISYVLAYYKDNAFDNNIAATYKAYADIFTEDGNYVNTSAQMSRLRWNHKWPFDPEKIGNFITARSAWVDENIDTIAEYATKGEFIDVTAEPSPTPTITPSDTEYLTPIGTYADKLEITREFQNGKIVITLIPKSDIDLSNVILYRAEYDDNTLTSVIVGEKTVLDEGVVITVPVSTAPMCKLMLWDENQMPLTDVISGAWNDVVA